MGNGSRDLSALMNTVEKSVSINFERLMALKPDFCLIQIP